MRASNDLLSMAKLSEHMTFEQNLENPTPAPPRRSLLAPPAGPVVGVKAIFWNERELRAGWRLLIYFVLFVFIVRAGGYLAAALHVGLILRTSITPFGLTVRESVGLFAALGAGAIMGLLESRQFGTYGLPRAAAFKARFWQGVVWGLAMITGVILFIRLLGGFSFGEMALHGGELWKYAGLWALTFLFVGFFEEFLFRGYTQFTLASGVEFWPAATIMSAVFAAAHLGNGGEDKVGALSVFVIAMFFCLTLRRTGNLWFAVGLHAAFDWGETFLFSVPDSGLVASGHMLNSSFHGPAWLTGGTVGPEGSVMTFVVIALAAVIFIWVFPPREEVPE